MVTKQESLENTILNAVWKLEENNQEIINVSDIQNIINKNSKKWAYTTVKTVLDRLSDKKILTRYKQGKKFCYRSKISRLSAGQEAIKRLSREYYNNDIDEMVKAVKQVQSEISVFV
jgi:predicted transcriptional regulator